MLKITLYKRARLSNQYLNVFSTSKETGQTLSVFERYLATLDKKPYEIDSVYQEKEGELIFSYEIDGTDIYSFNYMKVETIEDEEDVPFVKIERYCFIDDITIKNDFVYLKYSEDVFHSYVNKIASITETYLSNSRLENYVDDNNNIIDLGPKKLPVEYKSNKSLKYDAVDLTVSPTHQFHVVIKLQWYTLGQQGEITNRNSRYFLLDIDNQGYHTTFNSYNEAIEKVKELIQNQAIWSFKFSGSQTEYNIEIGDIYIFPASFNINYGFMGYVGEILDDNSATKYLLNGAGTNYYIILKQYTIQNNYKNLKIGTFSTNIDIENIGYSFDVKLVYFGSFDDFDVQLNVQNKMVSILNDFKYEPPIASLNSSEVQQQKIQKELSLANTLYTKDSVRHSSYNKFIDEMSNSLNRAGSITGIPSAIYGALFSMHPAISQIYSLRDGYGSVYHLDDIYNLYNSKVYTSSSGVFENNANSMNSCWGIVLFSIDSNNDEFVNKAIKEQGYTVCKYIENLNEISFNKVDYFVGNTYNKHYNYIKFVSINVFGDFPQAIANKLNSIFENGIKIWYDYQMVEE